MRSTGTDPLALTTAHMQASMDDLRQKFDTQAVAAAQAPPVAGGGIDLLRELTARGARGAPGANRAGETLGRSIPLAVADVATGLVGGLGPPMIPEHNPAIQFLQSMGNKGADMIAPPPPEGSGQQTAETITRGGMAGVTMGPMGVLGGIGSGAGQDIAKRMGGGPLMQLLGSIVGGTVVAGGGGLATRGRPLAVAGRTLAEVAKRDDLTPAQVTARGEPGQMGMERMGRTGEALATDMARQGGEPANQLVGTLREKVARYKVTRQRILDDNVRGRQQDQAQKMSVLDASRAQETGARQSATRTAQDQMDAAGQQAALATTGDRVADIYERHAGTPERTLKQYEALLKQQKRQTGEEVFGPLDRQLVSADPSTGIGIALQNPLIRNAVAQFADPRGVKGHTGVAALRKAYQDLGNKGMAAKRNGGALGEGTSMTALFEARDQLGNALEAQVDGFRKANAAYHRKATIEEAVSDGYVANRSEPADIADHLAALREIDPAAPDAFLNGLRLRHINDLRAMGAGRSVGPDILQPGSSGSGRLRLTMPDDASFQAFLGEIQEPGRQLARSSVQTRDALDRQITDLRRQGAQDRAVVRDAAARSAAARARTKQDALTALPNETAQAQRSVIASGRVASRGGNVDFNKALAEAGAGLRGPAVRDAVLAVVRGRGKHIPSEARAEIVKLLIESDEDFRIQAEKIIGGLADQRMVKYRALAGAGAATGAQQE